MIQVYPAASRFTADHGWLKSNFSFSFAEYYDPANLSFGPLRVLNDDIVQPSEGFGAHPHREMEIVSIVLRGHLQHQDSAGHTATTTFGGIQRMTAGTGVVHSEMNPSPTEEVNFLQLWFLPDTPGLPPSYQQVHFPVDQLENRLLPVVSKKQAADQVAFINQDLTIYLSDLKAGKEIRFTQEEGRRIFLFVIEGALSINGDATLNKRDSARITDTSALQLKADQNALFMLIDLP
ncbi:pirin family protein [Brevibacillus sp. B_LB10_24]|uniref:pirin family protein n=1 Tax=Brevibacillus sp. B_LB10_24 TaxID=3380645 RepID=UPI0038B728F1